MIEMVDEDSWTSVSEKCIVCTLFEGDHHFGVAALVNSLAAAGFEGMVWAGYRGDLPPWIRQLRRSGEENQYLVNSKIRIIFVQINDPIHFTNIKPDFMLRLIGERPKTRYIFYFDPDITVVCPWSFFEQWVSFGVALCEDINGTMSESHPLRLQWIQAAKEMGQAKPQAMSRYFNAGFVGLPVACSSFLELWRDAIVLAVSRGVDIYSFGGGSRVDLFQMKDQDALNLATMYTKHQLTTIGPEGMGFIPGGFTMYHAIGQPKPWHKKMIWSALKGIPPSNADKRFLRQMRCPIHPYSFFRLNLKVLSCNVGNFIGRFYRRH